MTRTLKALCGALILAGSTSANAAGLRGDYIEARTADVYTGPCFSNAEIFIYGDSAVMAWKVTEGSFNGVKLDGLGIAAAVRGTTTFSEDKPEKAKSVLIVDRNANPKQREALIAMAKSLAGKRLDSVVEVRTSLISLTVEAHASAEPTAHHGMPHAPLGTFWAPGLAEISTRPLGDGDHMCGNETVAYAPLSKSVDVLPAYTLGHHFKAPGLGGNWDDPNCRSSFVGHFSL
ncbi:DUF1326 domain-containing protein [Isosphaeraceae bacterium EP7]